MLFILSGLMAWLHRTGLRRSQKILTHFKGSFSFLGTVRFNYAERTFFISRHSSGRGMYGAGGGSYPVLMTKTGTPHRFVAGNSKAKKYYLGSFWKMKVHQLNLSPELFVASSDVNLTACAVAIIPQIEGISKLFEKNFSHLKINQIRYVENFLLFKKRTVMTYIGLPEEIYQDPKILEAYLETILELSRNLGFGLPDSD